MYRYTWRVLAVVLSGLLLGAGGTCAQESGEEKESRPVLTVGSPAPELDIEHWVQNGNGKFKPVTKFEPGKVYVVEFWATWCGPCIASMPHLAELQKKYADTVQIVSISDEDRETVDNFLDREVSGEEEKKTYRELTSVWCLTTDPDRSAHGDYMEAAGQSGIPTAFIVGKDGHIEWIGHPMVMDDPLGQVVAGSWDREAFREEFVARQKQQIASLELRRLIQAGDIDQAIEKIDALAAEMPMYSASLQRTKFILLAQTDDKRALELAKKLLADTEDGRMLNELAWTVYQLAAAGQPVSKELLATAVDIAEKGVSVTEGAMQGYTLDTLAHLKHQQGDLDAAIEYQSRAVKLAPEEQLSQFLEQLKEEKASKEKEGSEKDAESDSSGDAETQGE